jgi:hypothetical protein
MHHDYTREALLAAADSPHGPDCLVHGYRIPTDGLCSCHVGKARFALELQAMSFADNAALVAAEILPGEGAVEGGHDAAYRRALVRHAKKMGVKLD